MQMHGLKAGLQVDLSQFNKVEFDAENQSLAVGGSTTFSQLIDPLDKSGAQFRQLSNPTPMSHGRLNDGIFN